MLSVEHARITRDGQVDEAIFQDGKDLGVVDDGVHGEVVVSWLQGHVVNGGTTDGTNAVDGEGESDVAHHDGKYGRVGNESDRLQIGGANGGGNVDSGIRYVETGESVQTWKGEVWLVTCLF